MDDIVERLNRALAGRYSVAREIGRGGMATVYLATDLKHGRQVAIKVFDPELAAQLGGDRFVRETRLTANLQHPHIVALYDSGDADGFLYYVMPFVEGESLRARLERDGKLLPDQALRIARQVATALDYAHRNDVVHRDIKPENILLHGETALVADFGIARAAAAAGGERLTAVGLAVGTPAYMSPEQASGVSDVDGRSDLYSLGCVLYEMVAGRPPFAGKSPQQTLASQVVEPPPPLSVTAPHISAGIATVVGRLLSKSPEERYDTAADFADAIDDAATGLHAAASGAWALQVVQELVRRRVVHVVGGYVVGVVLAIAGVKWAVTRWVLSPHLVAFVSVAMLSLIPAVGILAYHWGGRLRSRSVSLGLPINVLASAALLFVLFGGKDLGAATVSVTLADEEGNVITRRIPKLEFRKHLAFFFLENPAGDTSLTWLQYGIPWSVTYDLSQDMFLDVRPPDLFAENLRAEGFADGLNVPVALMRRTAREAHLESFVSGAVARRGDSLVVTTRLYDTENGRIQLEREFIGTDPLALVDAISERLKADLGVPETQLELVQDLPVREMLTNSPAAFRPYIEGLRHFFVRDYEASAASLEEALAHDSLFALAAAQLWGVYLVLNRTAEASEMLARALANDYKVPERVRLMLRANHYLLVQQDADRAMAVARMNTELYPLDVSAWTILAQLYQNQGEIDSAAAQLRQILAIDSTRFDVLRSLGGLYMQDGRYEEARGYFQRYAERFPDDARAYTDLGGAYRWSGQHDASLEAYERAAILDPDDIGPLLGAARALVDAGRFDEGERRLAEGRRLARTPVDRFQVESATRGYYLRRGRAAEAIDAMHAGWRELAAGQPPLVVAQTQLGQLDAYVFGGQTSRALDTLRAIEHRLAGPLVSLTSIGYLEVYQETEDVDGLEAAIPRVEALIEQLGFGMLNNRLTIARGKVAELRGDCAGAIASYRDALDRDPSNLAAFVDMGACQRRLGRLGDAEREIRSALRVLPAYPRALYELGLVYRDRGDRAEAERYLEEALAIWVDADPGFIDAQRVRAALAELGAAP